MWALAASDRERQPSSINLRGTLGSVTCEADQNVRFHGDICDIIARADKDGAS